MDKLDINACKTSAAPPFTGFMMDERTIPSAKQGARIRNANTIPRADTRFHGWRRRLIGALSISFILVSVASCSGTMEYHISPTASDNSPLATKEQNWKRTDANGVLLCLSGGGYRALLFGLGVVWRMNDLGVLEKLDEISSVSGGSILAAYLEFHWGDLNFKDGRADNFDEVIAGPILRFIQKTIDTPAIVWGTLLPDESASTRFSRYLDQQLFHGATLGTLSTNNARPVLSMFATDFETGSPWVFHINSMGLYEDTGVIPSADVKIADAVAASAAFPPFLSPAHFHFHGAKKRMDNEKTALDANIAINERATESHNAAAQEIQRQMIEDQKRLLDAYRSQSGASVNTETRKQTAEATRIDASTLSLQKAKEAPEKVTQAPDASSLTKPLRADYEDMQLGDGGLVNNLGTLICQRTSGTLCVISDAAVIPKQDIRFWSWFGQLLRVVDILYDQKEDEIRLNASESTIHVWLRDLYRRRADPHKRELADLTSAMLGISSDVARADSDLTQWADKVQSKWKTGYTSLPAKQMIENYLDYAKRAMLETRLKCVRCETAYLLIDLGYVGLDLSLNNYVLSQIELQAKHVVTNGGVPKFIGRNPNILTYGLDLPLIPELCQKNTRH